MNASELFKVIPENFFSLLSGEKKHIYLDCMFILYQYMGGNVSYSCTREEVIPLLMEYFTQTKEEMYDEEGRIITDFREQANAVLRRFIQTHWLSKRLSNNYEEIISFHDYTVTILQAFTSLHHNNKLALQGLVYRIYSVLKNANESSITVALDEVYEGTSNLISELKKLLSNLNKYLQRVVDRTQKENPTELIHLHFEDFLQDETYAAYHRLKTSENISKFRPFIIERLEEIRSNQVLLNHVINELIEIKQFDNADQAHEYTLSKINEVIEQFRNLDDYILKIDEKNHDYLRKTITKIRYLMHSREDIEGKINGILKYMVQEVKQQDLNVNSDSLDELSGLFNIYQQQMIDYQSLYTVKRRNHQFKPKPVEQKVTISEQEREERLKKLAKSQQYSKSKVKQKVAALLNGKTIINASSLPLETNEDFLLLIYIYLYGHSPRMGYTVNRLNEVIVKKPYRFMDFEIRRKSNG